MAHLHRWTRQLVEGGTTIGDLLTQAVDLAQSDSHNYAVLVPFRSLPGAGTNLTGSQSTWLEANQVVHWLANQVDAPTGVRQNGGFLYNVVAKDPHAAVSQVLNIVERLVSRSSFARLRGKGPEVEGSVWVAGTPKKYHLRPPTRGAQVLSLAAEARLYDVVHKTALDDALELAAVLNHGSPGPAIAGGWAAVEALLVSPKDEEDSRQGRGATAADRLATLVACSWPRSELTGLSHRHAPTEKDRLTLLLAAAATNRERCKIVADWLSSRSTLAVKSQTDKAAVARMVGLLAAPRATLGDVNAHVRTAMRRLYRNRNIVMHGGATSSTTLDATLRTSAPLVGAGLDRITHAALTDGVDALTLSDRAHLQLALIGSADGPHVADLLE